MTKDSEYEHINNTEPPLKTVRVSLNLPDATGQGGVKALKVEVRIFKAGGTNRQHM